MVNFFHGELCAFAPLREIKKCFGHLWFSMISLCKSVKYRTMQFISRKGAKLAMKKDL